MLRSPLKITYHSVVIALIEKEEEPFSTSMKVSPSLKKATLMIKYVKQYSVPFLPSPPSLSMSIVRQTPRLAPSPSFSGSSKATSTLSWKQNIMTSKLSAGRNKSLPSSLILKNSISQEVTHMFQMF